jgi:hypothetical protein
MLFLLLTAVAPTSAQYTKEKFVKCKTATCSGTPSTGCWPKSSTKWYYRIQYNKAAPNLEIKELNADWSAHLINLNYASSFSSFEDCPTSAGGGNVHVPVVKCLEDNKFYYLTNYLGVVSGTNIPTNYFGTARPIQKRLISGSNANVLATWGYFSGGTYNSRQCGTISSGASVGTNYANGAILFCGDKKEFYRVINDANSARVLRSNIGDYVPELATKADGTKRTSAEIRTILNNYKASPAAGCVTNTVTGARTGACSLPSQIIHLSSCPGINVVSKRQSGAEPRVNGQYYTCESDPSRLVQYIATSNSIRDVTGENNDDWNNIVATAPFLDCGAYATFSKKSMEKRGILPGYSARLSSPSAARMACLSPNTCSDNGYALLFNNNCHSGGAFASAFDGATLKGVCARELALTCAASGSPYRFVNPNIGDSADCSGIYSRVRGQSGVINNCLRGKGAVDCNNALSQSVGDVSYAQTTRNLNSAGLLELQAFMVFEETTPKL